MNVTNTPIDDLKPYAHNPKTHPAEQVEKIARSIEEFGFLVPILIDADNSIIAGHGRLMAARKLGLDEIPTICIDHLTEAQIRAYRIADNRLTESAWDIELLESEMAILQDMDFDIDLTGFDDIEIGEMFPTDPEPEDFDAEAAMDDKGVPLVQSGELWILGDHRLLCGDSTKSADVERLMDGARADMVFTDPPYGINADKMVMGIGKKEFHRGDWDSDRIDVSFLLLLADKVCIWGGNYFTDVLPPTNDWLCWNKKNYNTSFSEFELAWTNFNKNCRIFIHNWGGETKQHVTMKPLAVCIWGVEQGGGDCINILDLFGGSGSTLIACEQLNRKCYMMELDPHYCGVILDRWANYTKEDPIRDDGTMWSELKESQQL